MNISIIKDRLKNFPTRNKPCIFFMHIPKTGGMSLISSLKKNYPFNFFLVDAESSLKAAKKVYGQEYNSFEHCFQLRQSVAAYAMESRIKCISGHIPYSRNLFENTDSKYLFITVLRDPVQRFISKYLYNFHKTGNHCSYDMTFSEYINSEIGRNSGREYLRFLNDANKSGKMTDSQMIEKSKENILKFDVVGFLEEMDRFAADFQKKTGLKLKIPHINRTADLAEVKPFDQKKIERIEEICKFDIEIYQHARKHFQ